MGRAYFWRNFSVRMLAVMATKPPARTSHTDRSTGARTASLDEQSLDPGAFQPGDGRRPQDRLACRRTLERVEALADRDGRTARRQEGQAQLGAGWRGLNRTDGRSLSYGQRELDLDRNGLSAPLPR